MGPCSRNAPNSNSTFGTREEHVALQMALTSVCVFCYRSTPEILKDSGFRVGKEKSGTLRVVLQERTHRIHHSVDRYQEHAECGAR